MTAHGVYKSPLRSYGDARAEVTHIVRDGLTALGESVTGAFWVGNDGPSRNAAEVNAPYIVVADDGVVDDAYPWYEMRSVRVTVWHTDYELGQDLAGLCLTVLLRSWRGQLEQCTRESGPIPDVDPATELYTQTLNVRARMAGIDI